MKFLLVAMNAKYIHSNLGIYSLKAYGSQKSNHVTIEIGEYTINHQMELVLKDIFLRQPDVIGFSCYIWNIGYIMELVRDIQKVLPQVDIWLGGPEASFRAVSILEEETGITGIMMGEGEESFARLITLYETVDTVSETVRTKETEEYLREIAGIAYRDRGGEIRKTPVGKLMDMSRIPFSYESMDGFEHRIIYYESSRGCPFSCSYCLSSIDKSVRFRDLELVKQELQFFLDHMVPQVKFVDRTFNCKKTHAMAIWQYLLDHDNGVTNFHFEISADLMETEELDILKQMRPGLIQLEIGVQTTNQHTITEIRRTMNLVKLAQVVQEINGFKNIHQHLDLIAGLPFEDYQSFIKSFNDVYAMNPQQLQLGFLKVLNGSYMEERSAAYHLVYKGKPPYEVLSTRWLSYREILNLKAVEEMVEVYYNSGQFKTTIALLEKEFPSAFSMFEALAKEYEAGGLFGTSHNRLTRYEILYSFIQNKDPYGAEVYRDSLMYDLYLRENVKSRPSFARDQSPYKKQVRDFFMEESANPKYLLGYEEYDSRQMSKMAHAEVMGDGSAVVFDYRNRDPLHHNARTIKINFM